METMDGKIKCSKCLEYLDRSRYSKGDNLKLPICGDCYAHDYSDDLQEVIKLIAEYKRISLLPRDIVKDILKDDYDKIKDYIYSSDEEESEEEGCSTAEVTAEDFTLHL